MPHVFMRYLTKQFLKQFFFLLVGLAGMLVVFDVLAHSKDVLASQDDKLLAIMYYIRLRLSGILVLLIPIASLFSFMILFTGLVRFHEIEGFRAAGFSIYKILRRLTPSVLFVIALHFVIANAMLSTDSKILQTWEDRDYSGDPWQIEPPEVPDWIVVENHLIHVGSVGQNGRILYDVDVLKRDEDGQVMSQVSIERAFFVAQEWRYQGIVRQSFKVDEQNLKLKDINLPFDPDQFSTLSEMESSLSIWEVLRLIGQSQNIESYKSRQYLLWLQRKLVSPLSSYIMLILTLPLCFLLARQSNLIVHVFVTIFIGFSYYIAERLLMSLGEVGHLPVFIAAWSPFILYGMAGLWVLFMKEP